MRLRAVYFCCVVRREPGHRDVFSCVFLSLPLCVCVYRWVIVLDFVFALLSFVFTFYSRYGESLDAIHSCLGAAFRTLARVQLLCFVLSNFSSFSFLRLLILFPQRSTYLCRVVEGKKINGGAADFPPF
jgi:hypothetical protein